VICDSLPTRLHFDGKRWCAKWQGRQIDAERPAWMAWAMVDYVPLMVAFCRDRPCDPPRLLEREEVEAIIAWLEASSIALMALAPASVPPRRA
jgi:hypothetical protein